MPKAYQVQDKYFRMAKEEGFRARSAFKLLEIQDKFHIIKPGQMVLDLGAAPGSFLQIISRIIGPDGLVLGVDMKEIDAFQEKNVVTMVEDIFNTEEILKFMRSRDFHKADLVTSDLAPNTSGIKDLDQGRSAELTESAYLIASKVLRRGGTFIAKVFQGEDLYGVMRQIKASFGKVSLYKPDACRDRSFETYIVALNFKPDKIGS